MTGGLMQLVAYGAQDTYLTGNPQITFFKTVYRRHTNFSMETIRQTINGDTNTDTGKENKGSVIVSRNGDLLSKIYVTSSTVGITNGLEIIKEVSIDIGGQEIDRQTKEWFEIWNELTIPEDKRLGYKNMVGCLNNDVNTTGSIGVNHVQIPLLFWFCRNPGLALPLISLQYHEVQLNFIFGTGMGVNANLNVECDYFYLDTDERKRFAQVSHEYLIEQVQVQKLNNVSDHKISFNHPVKELIWTSSTDYIDASLSLNGHERFEKQKKEYFQLRQPYDYHSAIPGYNIPMTDKTELLTTPIDTGILKHSTTLRDANYVQLMDDGDKLKFGTSAQGNSVNFDKFKIGDMVSIVISTFHDATREDPNKTSSKTTFHKVTSIASREVEFEPALPDKVADGSGGTQLHIRDSGDGAIDHDRIYVYILGRIQQKESRCSKLAKNINVYSFSLRPEDHQPSGTCNFSRIDTARLVTGGNLETGDNIYAVNYNILRIMSGMGGVAYSN